MNHRGSGGARRWLEGNNQAEVRLGDLLDIPMDLGANDPAMVLYELQTLPTLPAAENLVRRIGQVGLIELESLTYAAMARNAEILRLIDDAIKP